MGDGAIGKKVSGSWSSMAQGYQPWHPPTTLPSLSDDDDEEPKTDPLGYCPTIEPPAAAPAKPEPVVCAKCNMKNDFGEPNQSDGSYICYGCR